MAEELDRAHYERCLSTKRDNRGKNGGKREDVDRTH